MRFGWSFALQTTFYSNQFWHAVDRLWESAPMHSFIQFHYYSGLSNKRGGMLIILSKTFIPLRSYFIPYANYFLTFEYDPVLFRNKFSFFPRKVRKDIRY